MRRLAVVVLALLLLVYVVGLALMMAATPVSGATPSPCRSVVHRAYLKGFDEEQAAGIARSAKWGWGAEVDATVTRDSRVVLVHDARLTRVTDGADRRKVSDLTYAEVRRVPLAKGGRVLGWWDAVRTAKKAGARLMVEVKNYRTNEALWEAGGLDRLANAIRKQGMTKRVYLGGAGVSDMLRDRYPDLKTYVRVSAPVTPLEDVAGHDLVKLLDAALNPANIAALKTAGHGVTSARVTLTTDPDWIRGAHADGINVFFTNRGGFVKRACAGGGS